ncbi:hypothetical protein ACFFF5_21670 [Lederbergia wuyishanensis]|uniref:Uncharacterized protein n=1 Tax=Lederbergia wuyishanensis TaxID=1347903 RepID=A0ABU0DB57_9BACI|nr:hypothetical protein [Lederbergia wuyishanensis]MCJ8010052.1 hypothetical protein [Lederbergia wuyishanensis]MDQ0345566.1 hypothetical protein [Lederbergia wuyishanensis]
MMNLLIFGPLLVLIILLVWFLISSRLKYIFKHKQFVKIFLFTYAVLLVLSVFVYEMLPHEIEELPMAKVASLETLDTAVFHGRINEIDPSLIREEWKFDYSGKELQIRQVEGYFDGTIIVDRKPENDGLIEVKYIAASNLDGFDITDEMTPLNAEIQNNNLNLSFKSRQREISFTTYKNEFVINQFTGRKDQGIGSSGSFGEARYVFLKIPKDLKIVEDEDIWVNYTDELQ